MRALLILFMIAPAATGGLAMPVAQAGLIYGIFTAMVYLLSLPGGWIADNLIGQRKAVLYGGILIAAGYSTMALPGATAFYTALSLVACGTGLLKPNVSTIVGSLYAEKRSAPRCRILYFLYGHQHRRIDRSIGIRICRRGDQLALCVRARRNWHDHRAHAICAGREVSGRRGHASAQERRRSPAGVDRSRCAGGSRVARYRIIGRRVHSRLYRKTYRTRSGFS